MLILIDATTDERMKWGLEILRWASTSPRLEQVDTDRQAGRQAGRRGVLIGTQLLTLQEKYTIAPHCFLSTVLRTFVLQRSPSLCSGREVPDPRKQTKDSLAGLMTV